MERYLHRSHRRLDRKCRSMSRCTRHTGYLRTGSISGRAARTRLRRTNRLQSPVPPFVSPHPKGLMYLLDLTECFPMKPAQQQIPRHLGMSPVSLWAQWCLFRTGRSRVRLSPVVEADHLNAYGLTRIGQSRRNYQVIRILGTLLHD